eukprot:m.300739 g.300739  ORF g.300739 m.300739 type:complete len:2210 (+) comp14529_c0_seq1:115-6744(+)
MMSQEAPSRRDEDAWREALTTSRAPGSPRNPRRGAENRVNALKEEYELIQKKTFTKWMNSHLLEPGQKVEDLYVDLRDGKRLLKLLEKLSGEDLPRPAKGRMRIHFMENTNKALNFLQAKQVKLESIGAGDVVDGNGTLTLGLIWTIILRFQIADIQIEGEDSKSAKEALLRWCQRKTAGYPGVSVKNFTTSWRDGLAFNAIIHKHRPDLFDFDKLDPANAYFNLEHAFKVAEEELGLVQLLDPQDVIDMPDEKSIMTYLVGYYHKFAQMEMDNLGHKRLQKVMAFEMEMTEEEDSFDFNSGDLLGWIREKTSWLDSRDFPNSVQGVQREMTEFKAYRVDEKPPRFSQMSRLEEQYFQIQTKLRGNSRCLFQAPEGKELAAIHTAWETLERAEHGREMALRNELQRLEHLELLATKFRRKAAMRESWIASIQDMIKQIDFGNTVVSVEASRKKEDAINMQVEAYNERLTTVRGLAQQLKDGNYHESGPLWNQCDTIMCSWADLNQMLANRRIELQHAHEMARATDEVNSTMSFIEEHKRMVTIDPKGQSMAEVEEMRERHKLQEATIAAQEKMILGVLDKIGRDMIDHSNPHLQDFQSLLQTLRDAFADLHRARKTREASLESQLQLHQFLQDVDDEELWIQEREVESISTEAGSSVATVLVLQKNIANMQVDIGVRQKTSITNIVTTGRTLMAGKHYASATIKERLDRLGALWNKLKQHVANRKVMLDLALLVEQYMVEANDVESALLAKEPIVANDDLGRGVHGAQSVQKAFSKVAEEVSRLSERVADLRVQVATIEQAPQPAAMEGQSLPASPTKSTHAEVATPSNTVEVESAAPRAVTVLYDYAARRGKELTTTKGEKLDIVSAKDKNWWKLLRPSTGESGYVPANYVQVIEIPRSAPAPAPAPAETAAVAQPAASTSPTKSSASSTGLVARVATRQSQIEDRFAALEAAARARTLRLAEAVSYQSLMQEVNDLDAWCDGSFQVVEGHDQMTDSTHLHLACKAFDAFRRECETNSTRLRDCEVSKDKLVREGHGNAAELEESCSSLRAKFDRLMQLADVREKELNDLLALEQFKNKANETTHWAASKTALIRDDVGRDINGVDSMLRQHDAFEVDIGALSANITALQKEADSLQETHPEQSEQLLQLKAQLDAAWVSLANRAHERRFRLREAKDFQIFASTVQDCLGFLSAVKRDVVATEPSEELGSAQTLLARHMEHKLELEARADALDRLRTLLEQMHHEGYDKASESEELLKQLEGEYAAMTELWEQKRKMLEQNVALCTFEQDSAKLCLWLDEQEPMLTDENLGDSVAEVEQLLKQLDTFTNNFAAREEASLELQASATRLIENEHYDSVCVASLLEESLNRLGEIAALAGARRDLLADSLQVQQFLRDADEAQSWLAEKMVFASDQSYRDPSNLRSKIKAHDLFSEILTNDDSIARLNEAGDGLIGRESFAQALVETRLGEVNATWEELLTLSEEKRMRLLEAQQEQAFARGITELETWMDSVDTALRSQEVGKDYTSASNLLKKNVLLQGDVIAHQADIEKLSVDAAELIAAGNFQADKIESQTTTVCDRFAELVPAVDQRVAQLEQSVALQKYLNSVEGEEAWIRERDRVAQSTELGQNLHSAHILSKQAQQFHSEVEAHATLIANVIQEGAQLVGEGHYAAEDIATHNAELEQHFGALTQRSAERVAQLDASVALQAFLESTDNACAFIVEKLPQAMDDDYGRDAQQTDALRVAHSALQHDIDGHARALEGILASGEALVAQNHAASDRILGEMADAKARQAELEEAAAIRAVRLADTLEAHRIRNDIEESRLWIAEKLPVAEARDIGKDQEDCEVIRTKFSDFAGNVAASEADLCLALKQRCNAAVERGSFRADEVAALAKGLDEAWSQLTEAIAHRSELLASSFEIHQFNRMADELHVRIHDKLVLASSEEVGRDLAGVEALRRNHKGLERDLQAVEVQIQTLEEEANRLVEKFGKDGDQVAERRATIRREWEELQENSAHRRTALENAYNLQYFLSLYRYAMSWSNDMILRMEGQPAPRELSAADVLLQTHQTNKAEIDARQDTFETVRTLGQSLIDAKHPSSSTISDRIRSLNDTEHEMRTVWKNLQTVFEYARDLLDFKRNADNADAWLAIADQIDASSNLGASVDEVKALLEKQAEIEKSMAAQEAKFAHIQSSNYETSFPAKYQHFIPDI